MSERKSILCPNCRKLISMDEPSCPYCGLTRPGLHNTAGAIRKIFFGTNPVMAIIYINIAYYFLSLIFGGISNDGSFNFLSPSNQSLFLLGASGTYPVIVEHRFWTLISASFLHGGLMHILFNMMALYQLGPFVLQEFGFHRFINLYIITGACGFAASVIFGVPFTIGASASVCGLIGAIIYYGKSRGGSYGEAIYKQAMGWVIGLIFFGLIFPGINNWAHGGGLLSGIALSFLMGYNDNKPESAWSKLLAFACILLTAAILIWAVISSLLPGSGIVTL
ncbi:MAG: rhomboid family intramembrane serine protease [Deltaproteobacteria bacterium HGW-Deltaproteobacteria-2]|jgi:rhomboid protease GluP|nr:MAG: rhomboid family intramembrane serine protease [Deltaproteobacteria bacterium HGW-Deltaproteobacteria-2]